MRQDRLHENNDQVAALKLSVGIMAGLNGNPIVTSHHSQRRPCVPRGDAVLVSLRAKRSNLLKHGRLPRRSAPRNDIGRRGRRSLPMSRYTALENWNDFTISYNPATKGGKT
jgi:hypothetical protein